VPAFRYSDALAERVASMIAELARAGQTGSVLGNYAGGAKPSDPGEIEVLAGALARAASNLPPTR
jgi:hypothetical protein